MDRDLTAATPVRAGDRDLNRHRPLLGEDRRRLEGKFLDDFGANLLTRTQGQLEEGGAGQERRVVNDVFAEPRMGGEGKAAGEQEPPVPAVRQLHRSAKQRMVGLVQADRSKVARSALCGVEPVALALEGIRRQRDAFGASALEEGLPIKLCTGDVSTSDRG